MNTDKDDVRDILLADIPWTDQRDVILAMLSAAHAKGRADGLREAMTVCSNIEYSAPGRNRNCSAAIEKLLKETK